VTVEQMNVVDCQSIDPETGEVWLTISDHLDWGTGRQEELEHLWTLQEKINVYLGYMESGEIYKKYPPAKGRKLVIDVVGKFPLSEKATFFFEKTRAFLETAGYKLQFRHQTE
jgi:hypothetical protein